jgi:carboxypeptidase Taq
VSATGILIRILQNIVARREGGYRRAAMQPPAFSDLKNRLAEIHDLDQARAVLFWDERTMMPAKGVGPRTEQIVTLERLRHERLTSSELGRLLEELRPYEESIAPDSDEASLIRVARRDHEKGCRVPTELRAEIARAASLGEHAWREARELSDFERFLPYLEKNVELKLRYSECFEPLHVYDPLLDNYEQGMTTVEAERVLGELKAELIPFATEAIERARGIDDSIIRGRFPISQQEKFLHDIAEEMPIAPDTWRLDVTTHPFASALAITDIRVTTRYDEADCVSALFCFLHELGHGLYGAGVDPALERTPLAGPDSLALHESQSRLWESNVGRSLPFWRHFFPLLKSAFGDQLGDVDAEVIYRAVNKVQPSLIRVDADEVTYNLHVILRFELEQKIFKQEIEVRDLPEAWNARMHDYLGVEVPDDAHGVLQDVHWAEGVFGYFPTYSLGNIVSGQIWEAVRRALPDLDDQIERGEFGPLREWLRENLHRHGRKFTPAETLERAVGSPIDVHPYLAYLHRKFGEGNRIESPE